MDFAFTFLHLVFVGFVALFPPVNPIGTALIINPVLDGLSSKERKVASSRIAIYCFLICSIAMALGSWIFKLFGISIPVVQIAGGLLISKMGWDFLSAKSNDQQAGTDKDLHDLEHKRENIDDKLFYPLAFPMTTGAGTISVLLTLSAHGNDLDLFKHLLNLSALLFSVLLMCLLIYVSDAYTPMLIKRLGSRGEVIVNRLSAFLVFCVGIQIASSGFMNLMKGHP